MTLSGTITTEMRFIYIYTLSCCVMADIDTSSTVTPKEKKDKVYIHVLLLFATVAIVCTNQINYGLLQRFLYI